MRNCEACREAQANGLLRIPVNENPFEKRSGDQIALVGKIVEALRTSACKVEMVKHLVDFHSSPLAPRIQRDTLDTCRYSCRFSSVKKRFPSICFVRKARGM